jgi:signal transduction histidine kinase/ActR/RegA family two-component response regulator
MIVLLSVGSFCVGIIAILIMVFQLFMHRNRKDSSWIMWGVLGSLFAALLAFTNFAQYNTGMTPAIHTCSRMKFTALLLMLHSLMGFTLSFFALRQGPFHALAGIFHSALIVLLWSGELVFENRIISFNFALMPRPYFGTGFGPLGFALSVYIMLVGFAGLGVWIACRKRVEDTAHYFIAAFAAWLLFGIHDVFVSVYGAGYFFFSEYGVLCFAIAILVATVRESLNALRLKNEAEAESRAKTEVIAGVSHDFRTPLNAIMGLSQLLEIEKAGPLNPGQKNYVAEIHASAGRLLEMVDRMLDISRFQSGDVSIVKKPFGIRNAITHAVSLIEAYAASRSVRVMLNTEGAGGVLYGDEMKFRQIVYNLLLNAVKFTHPGTSAGIDAGIEDGTLVVEVWDEGKGVPAVIRNRVFEPFVRGEGGRGDGGSGLGLSICRHNALLHGGDVSFRDRPGGGTVFRLTLPGAVSGDEENAVAEKTPPAEQAECGKTVLVVDDNEMNIEIISTVLASDTVKIECAHNGKEAIELAGQKRFDLVLMDINLPDCSGVEVMSRMRKGPLNGDVHVFAISAFAGDHDRQHFLSLGFDDYIAKPYTLDLIIQKVSSVLSDD